jgi:omega-amidase
MRRYLNIGLMQSGDVTSDFETSLARIKSDVDNLMLGMNVPELIVGVEMAIGRYFQGDETMAGGDTIPGKVTNELSKIAKDYGIYFMPGSMLEVEKENGEIVRKYNSIPIFGPDGEIIDVYRKMCPYMPVEFDITPGDRYVTFDIKEKDIKIGVLNCHDWCFPEISRNLALMGAEILIKPAIDPEGLYDVCKSLGPTRALENQAYFISMNWAGDYLGSKAYGHSMVCGPEGNIIYEAGSVPTYMTITLDVDKIKDAREFGTCYTDQFLRQLALFNPPQPYAGHYDEAPIVKSLPDYDLTYEERWAKHKVAGLGTIAKQK